MRSERGDGKELKRLWERGVEEKWVYFFFVFFLFLFFAFWNFWETKKTWKRKAWREEWLVCIRGLGIGKGKLWNMTRNISEILMLCQENDFFKLFFSLQIKITNKNNKKTLFPFSSLMSSRWRNKNIVIHLLIFETIKIYST